jgi:hypothetical protein
MICSIGFLLRFYVITVLVLFILAYLEKVFFVDCDLFLLKASMRISRQAFLLAFLHVFLLLSLQVFLLVYLQIFA